MDARLLDIIKAQPYPLIFVTINLVELASEGAIGEHGIVPRILSEKRRSKAQTATHFDAQQGRISFSASSASFRRA